MVNCRSEVNTPLRLNGLTMRSASTPSIASRSTMPSGWATIEPNRTPLVTRSARASLPVARASATAAARIACKSAVISRAKSSTRPAPISAIVCRSLEKEGSIDVELRALETLRHEDIGDVVGRAANDGVVVAAEAGVRIRPAGAAERRIDAVLALGRDDRLGRLRPSGAVDGGEFRLEQLAPALDEGGQSRGPGRGDRVEIEMGPGGKDALVPASRPMRRRSRTGRTPRTERSTRPKAASWSSRRPYRKAARPSRIISHVSAGAASASERSAESRPTAAMTLSPISQV